MGGALLREYLGCRIGSRRRFMGSVVTDGRVLDGCVHLMEGIEGAAHEDDDRDGDKEDDRD
jgi:hypothetical protein